MLCGKANFIYWSVKTSYLSLFGTPKRGSTLANTQCYTKWSWYDVIRSQVQSSTIGFRASLTILIKRDQKKVTKFAPRLGFNIGITVYLEGAV